MKLAVACGLVFLVFVVQLFYIFRLKVQLTKLQQAVPGMRPRKDKQTQNKGKQDKPPTNKRVVKKNKR